MNADVSTTEEDIEIQSDGKEIEDTSDTFLAEAVLSLCFNKEGAIEYFSKNLPPDVITLSGARELYSVMLDYNAKINTEETVDPGGFFLWLRSDPEILESLGGEKGFKDVVGGLTDTDASAQSVAGYLKYKKARKEQKERLDRLANALNSEDSPELLQEIDGLAREIRNLSATNVDPLRSVVSSDQIGAEANALWDLPDFLPTQYEALNEALGYSRENSGFCKGAVHAILAASGKGKPLDVNTNILMADGSYKKLGDIEIGDRVINRKGRPDNVTEVHEQGELVTILMKTKSGREIRTAYDHTFLTSNGWKEVKDILVGDELILVGETELDSRPDRNISEFQEAGRQGNYLVPSWVDRGASSQVANFIGAAFSNAEGKVIAIKGVDKPIIKANLFGAAGRKIQSLLQRMGISTTIEDKQMRVLDPWSARLFVEKIPLGGTSQISASKWQNRPDAERGSYKDEVVSFERELETECRCLTVENDHSFIANDFVVHNSTFAKSLMNHWVDNNHRVLYVNYEEARAHWERVLFTQVTHQNVYKAEEISAEDKSHYTKIFVDKMEKWKDKFFVKHDPDTPYFEDLEHWLYTFVRTGNTPDVVIVDTLQSMFLKGGRSLPRWAQFEEMMVRLEKLAKDLNCVMVITGQENSNRLKEGREVVKQSDIGGSLAIAQKSSIVIFITDAQSNNMVSQAVSDTHIMQLQIPKNRITGTSFSNNAPLVEYDDSIKTYKPIDLPPVGEAISEINYNDFEGGML